MKAIIFSLFTVLTIPCFAATYTVDDDGPADFNSIQAAIDTASDNDVIIVHQGTYYENIDIDIEPAVTLRSTDPNDPCVVANTIISGSNLGTCIKISLIEDGNIVISGFFITDGNDERGGGICCEYSNPTVENCIFSKNLATPRQSTVWIFGGAVYCFDSSPTFINCTFTANSIVGGDNPVGGACFSGTLNADPPSNTTFINCTFNGNSAEESGGAIYCYYGSLTLIDCTFGRNLAASVGGIVCNQCDNTTLKNCTFNRHPDGGIAVGGGNLTITDCTFTANGGWYGGINCNSVNAVLANCIFVGNVVDVNHVEDDRGAFPGALGISDSNTSITNCTFSQNSTTDKGGAIHCSSSVVTLNNSIFWCDTAAQGNELSLDGGSIYINYCNIKGGQSEIHRGGGSINWGPGNIDIDPCFVNPGYWDPNGTPTDANDDFWVDGDYHLKSFGWRWDDVCQRWAWDDVTSRCIDAGNPGSPLGDELLSVPDDPNNIWGQNLRINMGAYGGTAEASMPPYGWALLCDIDNSGIVDFGDYARLAMLWLQQGDEFFADFNRDTNIDTNDLYLLAEDWLDITTWH
jgi:predicted outer membrane repeat protein